MVGRTSTQLVEERELPFFIEKTPPGQVGASDGTNRRLGLREYPTGKGDRLGAGPGTQSRSAVLEGVIGGIMILGSHEQSVASWPKSSMSIYTFRCGRVIALPGSGREESPSTTGHGGG